jgi:CheY-like chemotaxis protein
MTGNRLASLRREIALACDVNGCVTRVEPAAEALLGASAGVGLSVDALAQATDAVIAPFEMIEASELPGMTAFDALDQLQLDAATRNIPTIIHTSGNVRGDDRQRLSADAATIPPKQNLSREVALGRTREVLAKTDAPAVEQEPACA